MLILRNFLSSGSNRLTFKEKLKAIELKQEMISEQGNRCYFCGEMFSSKCIPQMAHILVKSKSNIKVYGAEVIHHRRNMVITCPDCNSKAILNRSRTELVKNHVEKIKSEL